MSNTTRAVAGKAHVSILVEDLEDFDGYAMVVPTDVDFSELGDLVSDRLEANGAVTLPSERPDPGEEATLGTVTWDGNGIPIRLDRDDGSGISVEFNADGGVLQVTDHGGKGA